jgi:hypothetical protein
MSFTEKRGRFFVFNTDQAFCKEFFDWVIKRGFILIKTLVCSYFLDQGFSVRSMGLVLFSFIVRTVV